MLSGVIQGSVLGPILFIIYVNDVLEIFGSGVTCRMYADDMKLYSVLPAPGSPRASQSAKDCASIPELYPPVPFTE